MAAESVKVKLRFPTVGKKAGAEISVPKDEATRLIANGSAVAVKDEPKKS